MIRNIVLFKLKADADLADIATIQAALRQMNCPGTVSYTVGDDLGLREGNWSFGVVADFEDETAYRGYDEDDEHNRLRARLFPYIDQIARLQFSL